MHTAAVHLLWAPTGWGGGGEGWEVAARRWGLSLPPTPTPAREAGGTEGSRLPARLPGELSGECVSDSVTQFPSSHWPEIHFAKFCRCG